MSRSDGEQLPAQVVVGWLESDRARHEVEPLVAAEPRAGLEVLVHVERGDLDRLESPDVEGSLLRLVVVGVVDEIELAPDAAAEEALVLVDDVLGDVDVLVAEVREVGPELVLARDEPDVDLVDEAVLALPLELRLRLLGLVGSDEVLLQSLVDDLEAGRDRRRVVGRAVLAEQELKDVDGHVGADLDLADEVLADDPARERVVGQAVERVHRRAG